MTFTVLGAGGFVGRHLTKYIQSQGYNVKTPTRSDNQVEACKGQDVIYCIGITSDFLDRTHETIDAHANLINQILLRSEFKSLLYLSSTRVYARSKSTREDAQLTIQPNNPSDLYNISKICGESICLATQNPQVRVARLSNVVGPETAATKNFIGALFQQASSGNIKILTHPESEKDYIWIEDASFLLFKIATKGKHRIYNVASGHQLKNADWAAAISDITDATFTYATNPKHNTFPPIDINRAKLEFNFKPINVLNRIDEIKMT